MFWFKVLGFRFQNINFKAWGLVFLGFGVEVLGFKTLGFMILFLKLRFGRFKV